MALKPLNSWKFVWSNARQAKITTWLREGPYRREQSTQGPLVHIKEKYSMN